MTRAKDALLEESKQKALEKENFINSQMPKCSTDGLAEGTVMYIDLVLITNNQL